MKIIPTEEELGKDEYPLSLVTELFLLREAFLQTEMELISLEHVLYNQTVGEEYFTQETIRKNYTDITKLREKVKRKFSHLDRAISEVVSRKIIFESEDPGPDEIIN
jgi:hypothetical protein